MYNRTKSHLIFLSSLFLIILVNSHVAFSAAVSGNYQVIADGNIVFNVNVGQPAPSSLIIQHFHPPGSSPTAVTPKAVKNSRKDGFVKWFLKNPAPGSYTFTQVFPHSLSAQQIKLILRYKDPASGTFEEVYIQP